MKDKNGRKLSVGDYVLSRITLEGRLIGRVVRFSGGFIVMNSIYPSKNGLFSFVESSVTRLEEDEALIFILKGERWMTS